MVAPLVAVSRGQGIQADRTQGKVLQAGLCAASSGWGEGTAPPPPPATATLACSWLSWRHELPTPQA